MYLRTRASFDCTQEGGSSAERDDAPVVLYAVLEVFEATLARPGSAFEVRDLLSQFVP